MADISDVEQAVANTVTSILYPAGSSQSSIIGVLCRIYRGWPNSATLNADLSASAVNVTVVTDNDSGRTTTRYLPEWQTISSQPGVEASASAPTITIFGSPAVGDVVGALIDGTAYAYRIQSGDSPNLVASNLNQLIRADRPASAQGPTITIAGAGSIDVRVVCDNATSFESRRQEKDLRIICWCPSPQIRDAAAAAIDSAIDQINFLPLPDTVEYPTVTVVQQPSMLFGASDLNSNITYG